MAYRRSRRYQPKTLKTGIVDKKSIRIQRFKDRYSSSYAITQSAQTLQSVSTTGVISNLGDFFSPTNHTYTVADRNAPVGTVHQWYQWSDGTSRHDFYDGTLRGAYSESQYLKVPVWDTVTWYNSALSKAHNKLRGELDLAVSLAEAGASARMLRNRVTAAGVIENTARALNKAEKWLKGTPADGAIKRFVSGVMGRKVALVVQLVANVPNYYLEWKYGWKPLMNDIYQVSEQSLRIADTFLRENIVTRSYQKLGPVPFGGPISPFIAYPKDPWYWDRQGKQGTRLSLAYKNPLREETLSQWTSYSPLTIAYELIPFSFVYDWFHNVGNYLRNMETALLVKNSFVAGYRTDFLYFDQWLDGKTADGPVMDVNDGDPTEAIMFLSMYRHRRMSRVKLTSPPLPRFPRVRANLSSDNLLTSAALLWQQLLGLPRERKRFDAKDWADLRRDQKSWRDRTD